MRQREREGCTSSLGEASWRSNATLCFLRCPLVPISYGTKSSCCYLLVWIKVVHLRRGVAANGYGLGMGTNSKKKIGL